MERNFKHIESEIRKALIKYSWELLSSNYDEESFDNWVIEFKNPSFRLRLISNRGYVITQAYDGNDWQFAERYFKGLKIETVSNYLENNANQVEDDIFQFLSVILMNLNAIEPIKFDEEIEKEKIPLFLERHEIEFLCNEWRKIPNDRLTIEQREIWSKIAFKGQTSLHKKGMDFLPTFPNESDKYK